MILINDEKNPYKDQRYLTLTWRGDITTEQDPNDHTTNRLTALNGATPQEKLLLNSVFGRCSPEDPALYKLVHELRTDITFQLYGAGGKTPINPNHLPTMPGATLTLEATLHVEAVEDRYPGADIDKQVQRIRGGPYISQVKKGLAYLGVHSNGKPYGTLTAHWSDKERT